MGDARNIPGRGSMGHFVRKPLRSSYNPSPGPDLELTRSSVLIGVAHEFEPAFALYD